MSIFKKVVLNIFVLVLLVAGIFAFMRFANPGLFSYLVRVSKIYPAQSEIPAEQGRKDAAYSWEYKGKAYAIEQPLYESTYNFYRTRPKAYEYLGSLPENWREEYYAMFLEVASNDSTIDKLVAAIKTEGEKQNLSEDQILELAVAFVQSIPYDSAKAKNIVSKTTHEEPRFPYEVLYDNQGVCSDKSFLALALIRRLGYGAALFQFENENHMAIGIQCPKSYSSYDSGYCYVETTTPGHKIGIIPNIDTSTGAAIKKSEKTLYEGGEESTQDARDLETTEIFQKTSGKTYNGIAETVQTIRQMDALEKGIASLKKELQGMKARVNAAQKSLSAKKSKLDAYKEEDEVDKYNQLVPEYNKDVTLFRRLSDEYNAKVAVYNKEVAAYNKIIANY